MSNPSTFKTYPQEATAGGNLRPMPDSSHMQTIAAGFAVPLLQSIATGVFFGLIALVFTLWYKVDDWGYWSALVMLVSGVLCWIASLTLWRDLVRLIEWAIHRDLDHDHVIGKPPTEPERTVRVEVTERDNGSYHKQITELSYPQKLPEMAEGLLAGKPFSERTWVPSLFTPLEFSILKDQMLKQNFIRFRNPKHPKQGFVLTAKGAATLRGIAGIKPDGSPTLPPIEEGWKLS